MQCGAVLSNEDGGPSRKASDSFYRLRAVHAQRLVLGCGALDMDHGGAGAVQSIVRAGGRSGRPAGALRAVVQRQREQAGRKTKNQKQSEHAYNAWLRA